MTLFALTSDANVLPFPKRRKVSVALSSESLAPV